MSFFVIEYQTRNGHVNSHSNTREMNGKLDGNEIELHPHHPEQYNTSALREKESCWGYSHFRRPSVNCFASLLTILISPPYTDKVAAQRVVQQTTGRGNLDGIFCFLPAYLGVIPIKNRIQHMMM